MVQEQKEYLLQTACWSDVHPGNVLGQPAVVKSFDLARIPLEDIKAPILSKFTMLVTRQGPVSGLAAFFDTAFKGAEDNPAETEVCLKGSLNGCFCKKKLSCSNHCDPFVNNTVTTLRPAQVILNTAPDVTGATHWGQLTFQLHPPIDAQPGDSLHAEIEMVRQVQNPRLYNVRLKITHESPDGQYVSSHVFKID